MTMDPKDPRGSYGERNSARIRLNEFDRAVRQQMGTMDYYRAKRQVVAHIRPLLKTVPYAGWYDLAVNAWQAVLAGKTLPSVTYYGTVKSDENTLTGARASCTIIDDTINQETANMSKLKVKVPKAPKKDYNTVGVRFLRGHNLNKVYTYKVPKKAKLRLGEEIVVPTDIEHNGFEANSVAVVVELHTSPRDDAAGILYKFVTGRIQKV